MTVDEAFREFDALAPVGLEFMLGEWAGEVIATGHPGEAQLAAVGWVGKHFHDAERVDPIVVADASGTRKASPMLGAARLRMVEYRGASTATMIYDDHPVIDHFRKIDDDTALGVMDRKGDVAPLFFRLTRLGG